MNRKTITQNLEKALLDDGPLAIELFEYALKEHVDDYLQSRKRDNDKYFFAVTEHTNDVAILMIDEEENIYINEDARELLKKLWKDEYQENIRTLIPQIATQLDAGYLFAAGVKHV